MPPGISLGVPGADPPYPPREMTDAVSSKPAERRGPRRGVFVTVLGLGIALVALLGYGLAAQSADTSIDQGLGAGKPRPAPALALPVLTRGDAPTPPRALIDRVSADGTIDLRELRGTPVVLNFWASWCIPCRQEAPTLQRGWLFAASRGVLFLGVNQQDNRPDARKFIAEFEITYPSVREAGSDASRRYGVTGYPETFFVDARGRVVAHVIGEINDTQLRAGVAAAQQGTTRRLGAGGDQRGNP